MLRILAISTLILLAAGGQRLHAEARCESVLLQGIRDEEVAISKENYRYAVDNLLCAKSSEFILDFMSNNKSSSFFGAYKALAIDFSQSRSIIKKQIEQRQSQICTNRTAREASESFSYLYRSVASKNVLDAWSECVKRKASQGPSCYAEQFSDNQFVVNLDFLVPGDEFKVSSISKNSKIVTDSLFGDIEEPIVGRIASSSMKRSSGEQGTVIVIQGKGKTQRHRCTVFVPPIVQKSLINGPINDNCEREYTLRFDPGLQKSGAGQITEVSTENLCAGDIVANIDVEYAYTRFTVEDPNMKYCGLRIVFSREGMRRKAISDDKICAQTGDHLGYLKSANYELGTITKRTRFKVAPMSLSCPAGTCRLRGVITFRSQ